jgi:hypothetical protein
MKDEKNRLRFRNVYCLPPTAYLPLSTFSIVPLICCLRASR